MENVSYKTVICINICMHNTVLLQPLYLELQKASCPQMQREKISELDQIPMCVNGYLPCL